MPKKLSLGKGLDAVFLDNETPAKNDVTAIRISDIEPNPGQPRRTFDSAALAQLADSIAVHGVIQPIAVREGKNKGFYEIVAGERRWRAAKMAGLTEIPTVILTLDDADAAQIALIENIQREDLNPIEEALAYQTLLETYGMTQEKLSTQLGKSRSSIANMLRLLDIPEKIRDMLAAGTLSTGHAKAILSVKNDDDKLRLAEEIVKKQLSVRAAEAQAKNLNALREHPTEKETPAEDVQTAAYYKAMESRVSTAIGRKFRIIRSGGKQKVEIGFADSGDLERLIRSMCGDTFFDQE